MKNKKKKTPVKKAKKEKEFFVCGHANTSYLDGDKYTSIETLKKDIQIDEDDAMIIYRCTPVLKITMRVTKEETKL